MSDWMPTDEQVEMAAESIHWPGCDHHTGGPSDCHSRAMTMLAAVGPAIRAQALTEAADDEHAEAQRIREAFEAHNTGRDRRRPPIRPDLQWWADATEAASHRIRARAAHTTTESEDA